MPCGDTQCDVCVVGSGAAGGMVAMELSRCGASVVVLEAGKWVDPASEFLSHTMPYELPYRGTHGEYHKPFRVDPEREPFTTAGLSWRVSDHDLKRWPVKYADLAPYYERAERIVGVTGALDHHPNVPDGLFLKPLAWSCGVQLIKKGCQPLDGKRYKMITARKAILTEKNWSERAVCHYCGHCMRGCDTDSKYTSANTAIPAALKTGNCKLLINANAAQVTLNEDGTRVTGVMYYDSRNLKSYEVKARYVVLACGAVESARLLLLSKSRHYPNGLANSSGLVGKNLISHTMSGVTGYLKSLKGTAVLNDDGTESGHGYIPSFYWDKPHRDFPMGYHILIESGARHGAGYAAQMKGFGSGFKHDVRQRYPAFIKLFTQNGMMPSAQRFIELDQRVKDVYGLSAPKIHFSYTAEDFACFRDANEKCSEILEASGGELYSQKSVVSHDSTHYAGTCKMGENSKTSVLNSFCRTHDIPNLYVADGSGFVDFSEKNPTLTIMALALRSADHIHEQLRRT